MSLEEALGDIARRLEERGIPYMVIGGFANLVWGEPRTTLDLDITLAAADADAVRFAGDIGAVLVDDPAGFVARTRVLPVRMADETRIDLILATLPHELAAIERARPVDVGGRSVRICAPEDLVIHKIVSERDRDHLDVVGVLRRRAATIDLVFLDGVVEGLARDLARREILERYRRAKSEAGL